jgi:hypothetical protein
VLFFPFFHTFKERVVAKAKQALSLPLFISLASSVRGGDLCNGRSRWDEKAGVVFSFFFDDRFLRLNSSVRSGRV